MMVDNIQLLDCTLRDGGLALNQSNPALNVQFTNEQMTKIAQCLEYSGVDIIELGMVQYNAKNKSRYAIFHNITDLSAYIPSNSNALYAAFFHGPDIPIEEVPQYDSSLCKLIRMSIRYSELDKSLLYCSKLREKGYEVSIQPTVTMQYSDEEILKIVKAANEMNAYAVYIVDSYGCLFERELKRIYDLLDSNLNPKISIGFHGHNNARCALNNTLFLMDYSGDRSLIVDSCCTGMGQGAGNLETEIIINYLNKQYGKEYDFLSILKVCDLLKSFWPKSFWGYSPVVAISAMYEMAYQYAVALNKKYHMSLCEIASILQYTPDKLKYRYTEENLNTILNIYRENRKGK